MHLPAHSPFGDAMRVALIVSLIVLLAACSASRNSVDEPKPQTDSESILNHPGVSHGEAFSSGSGPASRWDWCLLDDTPIRVLKNNLNLGVLPIKRLYESQVSFDQQRATAIEMVGRRSVILTGGGHKTFEPSFSHFKVGIYARNCEDLVFDGLSFAHMFRQRLHSTPDREDARDWLWPHNNDNREWMNNYGACIVLENCKNCVIRNCSAHGTQNGIILDKCEGCQVYNNDFSYCSGWGCALWRSNKNSVAQNRFDYCVRGYSHGVYARGQDSAGILVFEQCCDNTFAYNSATHGGDGFFLYAGHETTQRTGKGGCNRNLVYGNDFSFAVANGIEATFSDGNVFAKNRLVGCDYGIWGGYSYNTLISQNEIADSLTAGVAIEHGHDNWIEGNTFRNDTMGVWLWWDKDKELTSGVYGQNQNTRSERTTVQLNVFLGNEVPVLLEESVFVQVLKNSISPKATAPKTSSVVLVRNGARFPGNSVAGNNVWGGTLTGCAAEGLDFILPEINYIHGRSTRPAFELDHKQQQRSVSKPEGPGDDQFVAEDNSTGGRETLVIGPWGPVNTQEPQQLDFGARGASDAVFWFSGPEDTPFRISEPDKGILEMEFTLAERQIGRVTEYRITPIRSGFADYAFTVKCNAHREGRAKATKDFVLRGTILGLSWNVSFWQWTPAEGSDLPPDWDKLVASPPLKTVTKPALAYNIQGGAPEDGVPADHFATVATTEIELPAGSWKLVLTSDDGARLFVDGEKVIERWDIHGPTDDEYSLTLEKPRLVKLRVEHFENTGWAALALRIERK
jgi:parallel beta-helix repeat protein